MRHASVITLLSVVMSGCAFFWQEPGTPLAEAAHRGDIPAIKALLASGADPNAFDATAQTALHWAARGGHRLGPHHCRGEAQGRPDIVAALIDGGADINGDRSARCDSRWIVGMDSTARRASS